MFILSQIEALVLAMQDSKSGVKSSEQKLNTTSIPHVIA
ncbi:regulator of G-protein signaling 9a isoform X1, partial [Tachysurus ichikawai]